MIQTQTFTQTAIRTRILSYQLQVVNHRSVNDPLLDKLIQYCVPQELLSEIFRVLASG